MGESDRMKKLINYIIGLTVFAGTLLNPLSVNASPLSLKTERLYGHDRIDTSIAISQSGWQSADTVILNEQFDYPDALSAAPLAKQLDGPILLTNGSSLDSRVTQELSRLQTKHVIVLGGDGLMTTGITDKLKSLNITWERIGGKDRFETSAMIARRISSESAIIVNGEDFADALTIAPFAGMRQVPILLTRAQGIPDKIKEVYLEKKPQHLLVVGGDGVVPNQILTGIPIEKRIGGANRYETAANVYWYAQNAYTSPNTYLASGQLYADAMTGAALAAKEGAPLVLVTESAIPSPIYSVMGTISSQSVEDLLGKVFILGGTGAISQKVQDTIEGNIPPEYLLAGRVIVVDPGHGTPDGGAVGPGGTKEKDNTLAIALKLQDLLRLNGASVIMTRTNDQAPTGSQYTQLTDLQARVNLANSSNADIFVSIHNDSYTNPDVSGTSTWYSSNNVSGQADESLLLASYIQNRVTDSLGTLDRGVRDANFYVNKYTTMPSALVEVGFISNPDEEVKLSNNEFRQKAANGIYLGIVDYFWNLP